MISENSVQQESKKNNCPLCGGKGFTWKADNLGTDIMVPCKCREKETAERLWRQFGVNPSKVKKLADYQPYDELTQDAKYKAINYVKNFDIKKSGSFGLFGQAGAGKSHIIIAIGAALIQKNVRVVYMPYEEVMRSLKADAFDNESYIKTSDKFVNADVLIIDDLFKDKIKNGELIKDRYGKPAGITMEDMKHIQPIINNRYLNQKPTLFSTECTPDTLVELDESLAGKLINPCGNNMVVFDNGKYDFRLKQFGGK